MLSRVHVMSTVVAALLAGYPLGAAINYTYTTLDYPGAQQTNATGINSAGQIVGTYVSGNVTHGFLYNPTSNPQFTTIDPPGSTGTTPSSIDDSGNVYGVFNSTGAFKYSIASAQYTTLASPTNLTTYYLSYVTANGIIIGNVDTNGPGFEIVNGKLTTISDPASVGQTRAFSANTAGQVLGGSTRYFVYTDGLYSSINATSSFSPTGIGPFGQLVGGLVGGNGGIHGAVLADGVLSTFDDPQAVQNSSSSYTVGVAINASGVIVGVYRDAVGTAHGFFATPPQAASGETTKVYIDLPNSTSGTLSGGTTVTGWAIDNSTAIDSVTIVVDGVPIGQATLGGSRPDVCAAFPNQVGCPDVGWTYQLDTTQLADGSHSLIAIATSRNLTHATATTSFTVGNAGAKPPTPLRMWIDVPGPQNSKFSGMATFAGWAVDNNAAILTLTAYVDNTPGNTGITLNGTYGSSRPDVCAVYPSAQGCPNVGWNVQLDTTTLANGQHTLTIVAMASNGDQNQLSTTFTVSNTSPIKMWIDLPSTNSGTLSGSTTFAGWAFDPGSAISSVQINIDNLRHIAAQTGVSRPDVCSAFPNSGSPDCPNVGWSAAVDTTLLSNGQHTFTVTATAANGDRNTTSPASFTVSNASSGTSTHVFIDAPNAMTNQTYWNTATFQGWALDDKTNIKTVQFLVDGNPAGSASLTVARPDVCAVYPSRPDCPTVGWQFTVDTLLLSDGTHTLTATAVSQGGSQATASSNFTVTNALGADETRLYIDSPNSQTGNLSGQATFAGWAINNNERVSSVAIMIDGVPSGNALYGVARPDVCQVFPSAPGCPDVGWTIPINTTLLPNGPHKLQVVANVSTSPLSPVIAEQSATATALFNVSNTVATNPVMVYIDVPANNAKVSGVTSFEGWAIDTSSNSANVIETVEVSVSGVPLGTASYSVSRPDVCKAFPNATGCPGNVGWTFLLDTTLLPNGQYTLGVTAISTDGITQTNTATFTVAN